MSRKFKIRDQEAVHFVILTTIQWPDILREPNTATFFLMAFDIAKRTKDWKFMPTVL
jgi:hypothetical protein